jgi:glycosyltransferase involved in cell wall biosynthesis
MTTSQMKDIAASDAESARYLLLATEDNMQGDHSGYTHLAKYIQRSILIKANRSEPRQFIERAAVRMLDSRAAARWYRMGSLKVEWRAWWLVQTGFRGLIHFMWAERDWGFLDQIPTGSRSVLCATFHTCPDTLPAVIRNTRRLHTFAAIILMSEVQRSFFESHGVLAERIHVIPHGVDCAYFNPAPLARSRRFTVLSVGSYRRNFGLFRKVCRMLEPYDDIRIRVVIPKSKADEFQHLKNVIVVSGIRDDELLASYREASCLLMTLNGATANNAILEAMACGLPIVSENVGGIAEYTGVHCAKLCEPGSAEALTESILMLYKNPDMLARMSLLARKRAEELDWPLVAEQTVDLYERLLDNAF